jgi:hypothetical protein
MRSDGLSSDELSVLKSDLLIAGIMLGTGLYSDGVGATQSLPAVAVSIGGLLAVAVFLAEHDVVPGLFPEVATVAALLVAVAVGVGFVVVVGYPERPVAAAALTGGGLGVLLYRTLFGLVRPVPAYRLEKQE